MRRSFLKYLVPNKEALQQNRWIQRLDPWLKNSPNYWKFNFASVSRGVAIGLFTAFMLMPFQTIIAIVLSILLRGNLILSIAFLWVNNPITMVPLYIFAYRTGCAMLNQTPHHVKIDPSWSGITHELAYIWKPFLLGSVVDGLLLSAIGYLVIAIFWKLLKPLTQTE